MDFGPAEGRPGLYEASFSGEETFAISAAYRERLARLALAEELDNVTDIDLEMSTLTPANNGVHINGMGLCDIATVLCEFASDTSKEVESLIRRTGTPNYRNESIAERIQLGRTATELAAAMREEVAVIAFANNFGFQVAEKPGRASGEVKGLLPMHAESAQAANET